jgi:hypothetical protein
LVPSQALRLGLGLPLVLASWLVFAAFIALIVAGFFIFPPGKSLGSFVLYTVIIGVLLALVGWLKGEPPRWRWGRD